MINTADHRPSPDEAVELLTSVAPGFEQAGVTVALETYEQVPVNTLVDIVTRVGSPAIGVCVDPGNCVAALELPTATVEAVAPYARNIHVKDFAFSRRDGWVGFTLAGCPLGEGLLDYQHLITTTHARERGLSQIIEHWLPWQGDSASTIRTENDWNLHNLRLFKEPSSVTEQQLKIALVEPAGRWACESPTTCSAVPMTSATSRTPRPANNAPSMPVAASPSPTTAVRDADVVILAVPDIALGPVSSSLSRCCSPGTIVLTLDPAAAYANLLYQRGDIEYAVAHPCHPSVFLQRKTEAELNDTFGGIAAPQDVVAALESGNPDKQAVAETVIRLMYAPVVDVHWVTVKQLAYLEPTLVEVVACMVGDLLNDALQQTIHTAGVPEPAARAMLMGHVQVALANGLRGDNPFSDACLIAMDYGREKIIKEDWKSIFNDDQLDHVLKQMLHLDAIHR